MINKQVKNKYLGKSVRIKQMGATFVAIAEGTIIGIYKTIRELYSNHPQGTHKEFK